MFLDHAHALGGAERSLLLLLAHLDRARWDPHLACCGGPLAERAVELGVPVHIVPMARLRRSPRASVDWLAGVRAIAQLARQTGAALVHANTVRAAIYGAAASRLARLPFVWHVRDFWMGESRPRHLWADTLAKRLLCRASARVIANSRATAAHLPCRARADVVYNGIEVAEFDLALDGTGFRESHGIPLRAPLVGMVGRLRPWKGQERFLRAMALVAKRVPAARFAVVGGAVFGVQDDYAESLKRLANELQLAGRVIFTGQLADVRPALAAMDVFVHPGDPEPFGLVNVEAMAMGRPVVAFGHGALPEIVDDGETGILVSPGDERELAEAVGDLLGNPALRQAIGQAGRDRAVSTFSMARVAAEVGAVFAELVR